MLIYIWIYLNEDLFPVQSVYLNKSTRNIKITKMKRKWKRT